MNYENDTDMEVNDIIQVKNKYYINLAKILSEIYFHQEAQKDWLKTSCSYKTIQIKQYGFINTIKFKTFYILYEKLNEEYSMLMSKLNEPGCCEIVKKVEKINNCLKEKDLYHNDLGNPENIFVKDDEIVIIDFGEARANNSGEWPRVVPVCDKKINCSNKGELKKLISSPAQEQRPDGRSTPDAVKQRFAAKLQKELSAESKFNNKKRKGGRKKSLKKRKQTKRRTPTKRKQTKRRTPTKRTQTKRKR